MGYILNNRYHEGTMPDFAAMVPQRTSVFKASDHDRQRADHKADLVNPYKPDGTVNPDFIDLYPIESEETYHFIKSEEEIAREH